MAVAIFSPPPCFPKSQAKSATGLKEVRLQEVGGEVPNEGLAAGSPGRNEAALKCAAQLT